MSVKGVTKINWSETEDERERTSSSPTMLVDHGAILVDKVTAIPVNLASGNVTRLNSGVVGSKVVLVTVSMPKTASQ